MLVGKHSGMGDLYKINTWTGKTIDCDTSLWGLLVPSCWNPFANDANISGNPDPAIIQAALSSGDSGGNSSLPVTPCTSSILSSLGVCDWMVYLGGALLVLPLAFSAMESGPRRYGR